MHLDPAFEPNDLGAEVSRGPRSFDAERAAGAVGEAMNANVRSLHEISWAIQFEVFDSG